MNRFLRNLPAQGNSLLQSYFQNGLATKLTEAG